MEYASPETIARVKRMKPVSRDEFFLLIWDKKLRLTLSLTASGLWTYTDCFGQEFGKQDFTGQYWLQINWEETPCSYV